MCWTERAGGISDPPTRVDYTQVESIEVSVSSGSPLRIISKPDNRIVISAVVLHPFAALPEAKRGRTARKDRWRSSESWTSGPR